MFLGRLGEVERASDDHIGVDHHDLVVGDGMLIIDQDWDSGMGEEVGLRVVLRPLAFI